MSPAVGFNRVFLLAQPLVLVCVLGASAPVDANTWSPTGSMETGRANHSATRLPDGRVLVAGGVGAVPGGLSSAEIYDPATGRWSPTAPMTFKRSGHAAVLLSDGRVLVVGGNSEAGAEIYDPLSGTWSLTSPMNHGWASTATLLSDGTVLVTGGARAGLGAETFDPVTSRWSVTGEMQVRRAWGHAAIRLANERVLVVGGQPYGSPINGTTHAEIYDPLTRAWSVTAPTTVLRFPSLVSLQNGRIFALGGGGSEIYDPATATWATPAQSPFGGNGPLTPTVLADGRVLGTSCASFPFTPDPPCNSLYDPVRNTWSALGSSAPQLHTATLLQDGRILVAGGDGFAPKSAAYLFALGAQLPGRPTVTGATSGNGVLTVGWASGAGGAPSAHRLDFFSGATHVAALTVGAATAVSIPIPPTISGTFQVTVSAGNAAGESLASLPFTFAIEGLAPPGPPVLTATQVAANPITLSWLPGAGSSPAAFTIQAGTSSGAANLASANLGLSMSMSAVAPVGVPLFVRVVALNAAGSATSNEISFTVAPPAAPVLQPPVVSGSTVHLAWSGLPGASFTLRARTSPSGPVILSAPVGPVTSFTARGVGSGTYHVTVVATIGGQMSVESNQVVAIVP